MAPPRETAEDEQPAGAEDRPSLQDLWQRNAELGRRIDEHLGRARP
ncbi:hypothetical protein [Streptomyces sp. NBC_01803]|nr:hypothetical protein [Streptomyces sp. NBC_01803]WSA43491.1 hypothetical protein OIE51_04330 [Streptomyces sp. NBC_01803]